MQMVLNLVGGFHAGSIFVISKRRMPKRYGTILQGRLRRQAEARATPPWVDKIEIRKIYNHRDELKRQTGQPYEVDHIVPLTHPLVCGLHVPWNMQVLHWKDNATKSNNWWPDMPNQQLGISDA